jgi:predicted 2-oxoglutarate/Fe(II)-dependent dioxygenase YbiX
MILDIVENFISLEECKSYIEFLDPKCYLNERAGIYNALGYPSSLQASKISEETGALVGDASPVNKQLGGLFTEIKKEAEQLFGCELDLCNASYQSLPKGSSNSMHSDTTMLDGSPIAKDGTPEEVEWSGLLYLNTEGLDFKGGTLFFEEFDLEYFPKAGDLVLFKGDLEHRHEVREVLGGDRKNIVFFWAKKGNVSEDNRFDVDYNI